MKKILILLTISTLSIGLFAQNTTDDKKADKIKTGWNVGGLPVVAYDTDLGFEYGALVNFFNYGDGSIYPKYKHNVYAEVSRYTKGSGINRLFYDSKYVIPGLRVTSDLAYLTDKTYDFYGFNGYESIYNSDWADDGSTDYRSRVFYKYDRKLTRFTTDIQGKLKDQRFGWVAGVGLYNFQIDSVDVDKLNKGKSESDKLPYVNGGLYQRYVDWGIINSDEKDGGFATYLKVGAVFDTRDNEPNPMKGIWTEAVLTYAPSFLGVGEKYEHAKLSITHRQYFTLIPEKLSFVYRLGYQGTLFGKCPFYLQPNMTTLFLRGATNEGLGGAKSLRGIIRNRVEGDGIVYGNIELRWKFVKFYFIKQNFYLSLNTFIDGGQVVKPIKINKTFSETGYTESDYFSDDNETLHASWGLGLRIVMNQNFIIAVDHGRVFKKEDGTAGTYIGLNFLF
ncbi:peptide-binding protein [Tenuifilaceae bacterium CYCD]|nr:peptide-binding protein [Tenuifilaceae bacterium CYCD]